MFASHRTSPRSAIVDIPLSEFLSARRSPELRAGFDLETDPVDTHTLYAAFEGNGIWKTTDRGETWTNFNAGIAPNLVSGDVASPRPEIALIREGGASGPTLYLVLGIRSSDRAGSCLHPFDPKIPFGGCLPSVYRIVDTGSAPQWEDMHAEMTRIPCDNQTVPSSAGVGVVRSR
jgi:hypothetical protein